METARAAKAAAARDAEGGGIYAQSVIALDALACGRQ